MFSFKINVGTSHFSKSRTCNCVGDTLHKYEILKNVSAFFFKSQISAEPCTDSHVKTQIPQHFQNTYVEIRPWLNLKNIFEQKMHSYFPESHICQCVTYIVTCYCFWKYDVHNLLFGNERVFLREDPFLILKNIIFDDVT